MCDLSRPRIFLHVFNTVSCNGGAATSVRFRTTQRASTAKLHERRAGEFKRLGLSGQRPLPRVGRPSLQSLYELAWAFAGCALTQIPRGTSPTNLCPFASAGLAAIEEHEQEHQLAAAAAAERPAHDCS